MQAVEIQGHARKMLEAHGAQAILEASRKAKTCEQAGDDTGASDWRRIENALRLMRGPRQT
ncbi:MAG: hypothetical protein ABI391_01605 [Hyphomicrobiaceae bacterium]